MKQFRWISKAFRVRKAGLKKPHSAYITFLQRQNHRESTDEGFEMCLFLNWVVFWLWSYKSFLYILYNRLIRYMI